MSEKLYSIQIYQVFFSKDRCENLEVCSCVCVNPSSLSSVSQMFSGVVIISPYKEAGEERVIMPLRMSPPHAIWIDLSCQWK